MTIDFVTLSVINISLTEILAFLTFSGLIVAAWIKLNMQITEIRTSTTVSLESLRKEVELQIKAIDSKTVGLSEFLGKRVTEFVADNKDDHTEIKKDVREIFEHIKQISVAISKIQTK